MPSLTTRRRFLQYAGTAATAALCGTPSWVIPFVLEQLFWGRQLERVGVGRVTIGSSREALIASEGWQALDGRLSKFCADVSLRMQKEPGVQGAAAVIDDVFSRLEARP